MTQEMVIKQKDSSKWSKSLYSKNRFFFFYSWRSKNIVTNSFNRKCIIKFLQRLLISSEYENQCGRVTGSLWFEQADIQLSHIHEVYCINIPRTQGKLKILRFCPFCGLAHASEKLIMLFNSQGSQCSSLKGLKWNFK